MSAHHYFSYLSIVIFIVLAPGPDTVIAFRHTATGGRRGGAAAVAGICLASIVQGSAAALGVGALIAGSQPVFTALRLLGAGYLCFLGVRALAAARHGDHDHWASSAAGRPKEHALRAGLLSNITNPKILAMYLSVLPQFLHPGSTTTHALLLAYTVAVLGSAWLMLLVLFVDRVRPWFSSRAVRRLIDAAAGTALVTFGVRLAAG